MCKFVAFICTEEKVLFGWSENSEEMDSHTGIIKANGLDDSMHGNFFRGEIVKPDDLTPFEKWEFLFDQTWTPSWYDAKADEFRCRQAILDSGILGAEAEYNKVRQLAWAEYEKVKQSALAEYNKVRQLAWAEYEKVRQPVLAEYEKVTQLALAEYEKVTQLALAEYIAKRKAIASRSW